MTKRVTIKESGKGYVISVGGVPKDTATDKREAKHIANQWRDRQGTYKGRTGKPRLR